MVMAAINWEELDKKPKAEQAAFFNGKFKEETISSFREIKKGDRLVHERKGGLYYHHFLCIGHDEQHNPKIIHYYGISSQALNHFCLSSCSSSGEDLGSLAKVHEVVLPHKDFLKDEAELKAVKRLVWPPQMRRLSVDEVVARACTRKGEQYYDLTKNNCENFVMWSLFDMNISLQVKTKHVVCKESLSALWYAGLSELPKAAIKGAVYNISLVGHTLYAVFKKTSGWLLLSVFQLGTEVSVCDVTDDCIVLVVKFPTQISSASSGLSAFPPQLMQLLQYQLRDGAEILYNIDRSVFVKIPRLVSLTGASRISSKMSVRAAIGVGVLIEIVRAAYGIGQAYKQWKGNGNQPGGILIKSREEFILKAKWTIITGAARFGFATLGMIWGENSDMPIPFLGGLVGSWVGGMVTSSSKELFSVF